MHEVLDPGEGKTRGSALFTPYYLPMDLLAFHSLPVDVFLLGDILA
jgi:hypothetical protein